MLVCGYKTKFATINIIMYFTCRWRFESALLCFLRCCHVRMLYEKHWDLDKHDTYNHAISKLLYKKKIMLVAIYIEIRFTDGVSDSNFSRILLV